MPVYVVIFAIEFMLILDMSTWRQLFSIFKAGMVFFPLVCDREESMVESETKEMYDNRLLLARSVFFIVSLEKWINAFM